MYREECSNIIENFKLKFPMIVENPVVLRKKLNPTINTGRWKELEHKKFLEAVILYGNDWKCVHKYIKSRSSTQARSHAQKFLLKLRKKLKINPVYDQVNATMKLSNESIQKIIKEIVETSSMRNAQFDKEKLVKLIMGFSNLLIGKMKIPEFTGNNYAESYRNFSVGNGEIYYGQEDFSKKVFLIEKIKKRNFLNDSNLNSNHFLIEKMKKADQNFLNTAEIKTNNIQISNQNDLLKLLLQQQPQNFDPANPNKNVINIISINICNKNEQENQQPSQQQQFLLSSPIKLKPDVNLNLSVTNSKLSKIQGNNNNNNIFVNKDQLETLQNTLNRVSTMSSLNESTMQSPDLQREINFDQDFYDESSSFFNFNPKSVEEEVEGFFNM